MFHLLVIFNILLASLSQVLLKSSAGNRHDSIVKEYLNWKVILGYSLLGISLLSNIYAMSKGVKVKEISSLEALGYMFVPVLSFFAFKEKINRRKVLSIFLIILGVIVFFI